MFGAVRAVNRGMTKKQREEIKALREKLNKLDRQIEHASFVFHTKEQVHGWILDRRAIQTTIDLIVGGI